jgi:O-antigen/teichoic acid export membrane protein
MKYGYLLALRVLPIGAQTAFFAMLLSQKGPDFAGAIVFFLAGYSVLRGLAPLGLDMEVLRVSSRLADSAGTLNRVFLFAALRLSLLFGLTVSLIVSCLALLVSTPENALIGIAVSAIPSCFVSVLVSFLRASKLVLRSQAIDAFGTAFIPTVICIFLLQSNSLNLFCVVLVFNLCGLVSLSLLLWLAVNQSQKFSPSESIQMRSLRDNGIAQALLAVNSRFPTLVTGFCSTATLVSYVDLGSKIQIVGATVAWLFGVFQSPIYAKDEGPRFSKTIRQLIRRSILASGYVIVGITIGLLVFSPYLSSFFGLSLGNFIVIISMFTLIALAEAPVNSLGYALAMTKKSRTISISIAIQITIVLCGVMMAGESLLYVCLAILSGTLARLAYVLFQVRMGD